MYDKTGGVPIREQFGTQEDSYVSVCYPFKLASTSWKESKKPHSQRISKVIPVYNENLNSLCTLAVRGS